MVCCTVKDKLSFLMWADHGASKWPEAIGVDWHVAMRPGNPSSTLNPVFF
jgi:hypothetical protein